MIGRSENVRSSRILEIGVHSHEWEVVGHDGTGETYRECLKCRTRGVVSGDIANAKRQDWLYGGDWEPKTAAEPPHEDFTFPRRRGRPPKNGNLSDQEGEETSE